MEKITLLNDQAIGEKSDGKLDGLGFSTYAKVLAGAAVGTEGPFTIGIFGEWGTGKTSLIKLVEKELSDEPDIVTVWFNAWQFEKEEHPIVPLIATIIRELERKKDLLKKLKDGGKSIITALRSVAYGFSSKAKVSIPGFAEIEAAFVARDMIDRSEKLSNDPLLDRSLYYDAFERISGIETGNKVKIVILIDDLDRCFPDMAIKLLESIKLVLSQPGFIFVLAVARSVIEGYLEHRYEHDFGLKGFQGASYLDKLVQLPFYIPPHHDRMENFLTSLLNRIKPHERDEIREILPIIGAASGSNPRATIRFVNNLLIDKAINRVLAEEEKMEIIPIGYFALSRSLQQRWGDIFFMFSGSKDLCFDVSTWNRNTISQYLTDEKNDRKKIAQRIIGDNDLLDLLLSDQGNAWLKNHDFRRAAIIFLRTQRRENDQINNFHENKTDLIIIASDKENNEAEDLGMALFHNGISNIIICSDQTLSLDDIDELSNNSKAIGILIGPNSSMSNYSKIQMEISENRLDKKIIPLFAILLPEAETRSIPQFLLDQQWLDLRNGISKEALIPLIKRLYFPKKIGRVTAQL